MAVKPRKKRTTVQVFQFSLIGGINAVIDIVSLNILMFIWPTDNPLLLVIFNTIAYVLAVTHSYVANSSLTFRANSAKDRKEIFFFAIQAFGSLIISNLVFVTVSYFLATPQFIEQNVAKGLSMFVSTVASFFFMRYFVFRRKKKKQPREDEVQEEKKRDIQSAKVISSQNK